MKKKQKSLTESEIKQMMETTKYFDCEVKAEGESGNIKIVITKEVTDRDGEILSVDGCDLENYRKNNIMLWGHRMISADIEDVIGNLEDLQKTTDETGVPLISGKPTFADHPKAQYLKSMVEKGIVKCVSVGFRIKPNGYDLEEHKITAWELLEVSWVTVPANTEAVVTQKSIKESEDKLVSKSYEKLLNYDKIHPVVKQYRKLFLSDEFCEKIGYTKEGTELVDMKNIYDLVLSKFNIEKDPENQDTKSDQENPDDEYVTKSDVEEAFKSIMDKISDINI